MTAEIALVLAITGLTIILFVAEVLRVDLVAIVVMVTLVATRILEPQEAITGFANQATVTVGAMFILSAGLQRTGAVTSLGGLLQRFSGGTEWRVMLGVMAVAAGTSAIINNTAAVAVFLPMVLVLAAALNLSPSRLLMPLSFAAMFGGTATLIGTSTNILVSAIADERGLGPFAMFEFVPLGLATALIGTIYMLTLGRRLIPERQPRDLNLVDRYLLREYLTEIVLMEDSPLVGKTIQQARVGLDFDLNIIDIVRDRRDIPLPSSRRTLRAGDVLLVGGSVRSLLQLIGRKGWQLVPEYALGKLLWGDEDYTMAEAVVAPGSSLVGQTLRTSRFRRRYGAVVLGMQRHSRIVQIDLANRALEPGDVLLLYGRREDLNQLHASQDFVMLADVPDRGHRRRKAPIALAIVILVVALAALNALPIVASAIAGSLAMVLTGVISIEDAYEALDAQVLVMLAGILSLGVAMETSGAAAYIANQAVDTIGPYGLVPLLSAFYLLTALLTSVMSNNATAALLAPIVISVAAGLGVSARPFLIAVTFAASASFITPIGYQTNTMIYGVGGYRFYDFLRVGLPLTLLLWISSTLLIPLFWPF